ncbi:MAG: AAA family ATPase, partial [Alphaproteobacteria bacterium]|nr:AAA family ATPase [Alphaproteobacteria bacterium]
MAETVGLIERAAALLRHEEAAEPTAPIAPRKAIGGAALTPTGPQLVLDRGRLAGFGIAIPSAARSRTVEEFRLVKRNLVGAWSQNDLMADRRASRLIMVTSARPGEGKTFTALNLALAFASERNVKALLVDVDTQHSTIPAILGIGGEKGIVDVLAGNLEIPEVLIQTNIPNLMILPAGRGGPQVPELLSSPEMGALLDKMTDRLADHYLIIDTPPCMASSDAAALAPLVGQIVFVVEANNTQQGEIEAALSTLSTCPRISLLLNKSDSLATEHFGSYGYNYHSTDSGSDEWRSAEIALGRCGSCILAVALCSVALAVPRRHGSASRGSADERGRSTKLVGRGCRGWPGRHRRRSCHHACAARPGTRHLAASVDRRVWPSEPDGAAQFGQQ